MVNTPSQLELSLIEGMDNVRGDNELIDLAQEAKNSGMNYVLHARYPNKPNKDAAKEVKGILNQMYLTPLYQENDPFKATLVYEENGKYVKD